MIPLRDVIPSRSTPYITLTIIGLNAVAWAHELSLSGEALPVFLNVFGLVPADFRPAALITSLFLHGSWVHVIGNMWYLWIFGDNIEGRLGHGAFVVFYLLCGTAAALAHTLLEPDSALPLIGASGAVAGVMGAYFVLFPRSRVLTLVPLVVTWDVVEVPAILLLGVWVVIQLVSAGTIAATAGTAGAAFGAHVAGFVCGVAGIYACGRRRREYHWA